MVIIQSKPSNVQSNLQKLASALRSSGIVEKIEVVSGAKVPLIKYVDALTRFPVCAPFNSRLMFPLIWRMESRLPSLSTK
jgi:DNA polymerase sigma